MHPGQFTSINSRDPGIFKRSVRELMYHARILDLMGLDNPNMMQIHAGGVFGDKTSSMERFAGRYEKLNKKNKGTARRRKRRQELFSGRLVYPDFSRRLDSYAALLRDEGRTDDGYDVLSAAVAIYPDNAGLYESLGQFAIEKGDEGLARQHFRRAQEIDPDSDLAEKRLEGLHVEPELDPNSASSRRALEQLETEKQQMN